MKRFQRFDPEMPVEYGSLLQKNKEINSSTF